MNNQVSQTYEFNGEFLHVYMSELNEPWFLAKEVGNILDIKNMWDKVSNLKASWKDDLGSTDVIGRTQQMTLINEPALYEVIMTMKLPRDSTNEKHKKIRQFRDWVFEQVLPAIRKTGKYDEQKMITEKEQYNQDLRLRTYTTVLSAFQSLGKIDDRDMLMFRDYGRSLMINDCKQPLQECSISKRVFDLYGKQLSRQVLMTLGKSIAKEYRRLNSGDDPLKREQFVDGTVRMINHYRMDDYHEFIDKILHRHMSQVESKKVYAQSRQLQLEE